MPNGVICGGAVDGSNQLGETVTNHAMTARPDGAATTAVETVATRQMTDASCKRMNARSTRMICDCFMAPSTLHKYRPWPGRNPSLAASTSTAHATEADCSQSNGGSRGLSS